MVCLVRNLTFCFVTVFATLLKLVMQLDIKHYIVQFHILTVTAVVFLAGADVEEPGEL